MNEFKGLNVLVCDDSITNTVILMHLVEQEINTNVITLIESRKIEATLAKQSVDLILLNLEMPGMKGLEVIDIVRKSYEQEQLPILLISDVENKEIRNKALKNGANDFLNKPFDQVEVILRVKNLLKTRQSYITHTAGKYQVEQLVQERTRELNLSIKGLLYSLAAAGELKDNSKGKHAVRVGKYARILAEGAGFPLELTDMIELTAPLHDIGKIATPESILLKPGRLNGEEKEIMHQHTVKARSLISSVNSPLIQMVQTIAANHHECWDGSGYPKKLLGESIPVEARITAIADVFDALTSKRPYKDAWSLDNAVNFVKYQAGKMFDPLLVAVFVQQQPKVVKVMHELAD
ncbi:HD domain-containing phosphohydrolase [Psychromonas ossibalaenae]|uniref:HD domain-containing phosphohydrolase n=1 Tax=Psychromonas ossibalaenae TaxID=444922 RepID=UPI000363803D|nr:HD domain-containing phosphohydrolase [Psychromonas ossibalaenae]